MGDWQGRSIAGRGEPPANFEPAAAFSARGIKWWNERVLRHAQRAAADRSRAVLGGDDSGLEFEPVHILMVSHGGLIGNLVTNLLGSRKVRAGKGVVVGRCYNASISVIELDEKGHGVLVSYSDTTHIDGELVENVDVQP